MPYGVYLGNTSKRLNSTKRPSYNDWLYKSVVLKIDTDLDHPTWTIYHDNGDTYPQWNYAYVPAVHGYFWITGIVSVRNNVWQVTASLDVLATYKSEITGTHCYIEYGNNTDASGSRTRLRDARQNVAEAPTIKTATASVPSSGVLSEAGTFMLSAVGSNGATLTFGLTGAQVGQLVNKVSQDADDALRELTTIEDIVKYLTKQNVAQGSAISAIRNCTWIPVSRGAIPWTGRSYIWLGDFDTGILADNITSDFVVRDTSQINIPWPVSDWRRMNCQICVYVPYIGTVGVPVEQCNTASLLNVTWTCEVLSGGICVRVETDTGYTVYIGSSNIGSPYPVGASNIPISNMVNGTVTAVGGALQAGGGVLSAVANPWDISSGIGMAVQGAKDIASGYMQSITPVLQCAGGLGSSAAYKQSQSCKITVLYYPPIDDAAFSAVYGHPVMAMGHPIAGYCKTRGFSVSGNMRSNEKSMIAQYMDTGVFIE